MRICFVIGSLDRAGAERQLLLVAGALRARGHDVGLVVLHAGGELLDQAYDLGLKVFEGRRALESYFGLRSILKRRQVQVVYSFMPLACIVSTFASVRLQSVVRVWGIRSADMNLGLYGLKARVARRVASLLSGRTHTIIANSEAGKRFHVGLGYPVDRVQVVPNGVDCSKFEIDASLRRRFREAHGFVDSDLLVGMLARFDPIKGQRDFVESMAVVRKTYPDVKTLLIGGGDEQFRASVRELLERKLAGDEFVILGSTDSPEEVLNGLDVLVISSQSEGSPNVALEAMACGVTVVGYPVGDLAQMVVPPCRISDQHHPDSLAIEIIGALAANPTVESRQRLRDHVRTNYSVELMVDRTESLLLAALADSRKS